MANSGFYQNDIWNNSVYGRPDCYALRVEWETLSQNKEENTSTVKFTVYFVIKKLTNMYNLNISSSQIDVVNLTVDGITYVEKKWFLIRSWLIYGAPRNYELFTKTIVFNHKNSGHKNFDVSCSLNCHYLSYEDEANVPKYIFSNAHLPNENETIGFELDQIPRPTIIDLKNSEISLSSDTLTIELDRKSDTFTHTLKCEFGNIANTIASGVGESFDWSPTLEEYANEIPNDVRGIAKIICETYENDVLIGSTDCNVTLCIPENVIPVVSSIDWEDTVETNGLGLLQNVSKLSVEIKGNGIYGSTIEKYEVTFDGMTYNEQSFTCQTLRLGDMKASPLHTQPAFVDLKATVTDSRGRTSDVAGLFASASLYSFPTVDFNCYRVNADGLEDPEGTTVLLIPKYSVISIAGKNTSIIKAWYRESGSETWIEDVVISDLPPIVNDMTGATIRNKYYCRGLGCNMLATFDPNKSYEIKITVEDSIGTDEKISFVGNAFALVDLHNSGNGIAFGKVSEYENIFEIAMKTKFTGGISSNILISCNLNDVTVPNRYSLTKSNTYENSPLGGANALLTVEGIEDVYLLQSFKVVSKTDSRAFERVYDSADGWGSWREV